MCGRFSLRLPHADIRQIPGNDNLDADEWIDEDEFVPRYNIAPRTYAPVLRRRDPGPSDAKSSSTSNHPHVLQSMKWGLVPYWSKVEDKSLSTTNARAENLIEGGGMWASMKGKKRCAILCQGYYEWLTKGKEKLPHYTKHKDGRLMLMAGLYDCVTLEGQQKPLWTFAIVTTAANKDFEWLHDRQPVILSTREASDKWLDTSSGAWTAELSKLVEPYHDPSSPLECYQVPKEVGKVGMESPTFIEPVSRRKDGIEAMFMKQQQTRERASRQPPTVKHSRSKSPPNIDLTHDDTPPSPKKHKKAEEKEVIMVELPSSSQKAKQRTDSPRKKEAAKKDKRSKQDSAASSKITSFFHKT